MNADFFKTRIFLTEDRKNAKPIRGSLLMPSKITQMIKQPTFS